MYPTAQYSTRPQPSTSSSYGASRPSGSGGGGDENNPNPNRANHNSHWEQAFVSCNHCLQPISNCRNVLTPCLHCFCYPCAQQQFALNPGCPVCKVPFEPSKDVRCVSTTDTDAREYGRRLCSFSPRQLVDIFSYALKFWSWQQHITLKFKSEQTNYDSNGREQQMQQSKQRQQELQQNNVELTSQNQSLINSNASMKRYIQQLEHQLQKAGGQPPSQYPSSADTQRQQQQQHQYAQTPRQPRSTSLVHSDGQGYPQTPAYRSTSQPPFTPFARIDPSRGNESQNTNSNIRLPTATPAVFGMVPFKGGAETPHPRPGPQHTSYSNGIMTPFTPAVTLQQSHQQQPPSAVQKINITPSHVLGERGRVAATRRANQG